MMLYVRGQKKFTESASDKITLNPFTARANKEMAKYKPKTSNPLRKKSKRKRKGK